MSRNLKGSLFLVAAAFVWGLAFVAQKDAADGMGVFSFTFARSSITCITLLPVCLVRFRRSRAGGAPGVRAHIKTGLVMGILLFASIVAQQMGLSLGTSASKSGFITALYIVIVPIMGLFIGQRPGKKVWLAVLLGLTGAALLSLDLSESFSIGLGEGVTLICSILFSIHIIYIDSRAGGLDSGLLNALQFCVCAVLGFACMFIFEKPALSQFTGNLTSILYVGVFSGAIGYTFQLVGQKYASPALASLLMCLESVFAALGGWIIGGEVLTSLEYLGCALLLSGCVVAQLPDRRQNN